MLARGCRRVCAAAADDARGARAQVAAPADGGHEDPCGRDVYRCPGPQAKTGGLSRKYRALLARVEELRAVTARGAGGSQPMCGSCRGAVAEYSDFCSPCFFKQLRDACLAAAPGAASGEAEQRRADPAAQRAKRARRASWTPLDRPLRDPAGGPRLPEAGAAGDCSSSD